MYKRAGAVAGLVMLALTFPIAPAAADKPSGACPSEKWQMARYELDWQPGDPLDPTGENLALQIAIAGFIEVFGSVDAGVAYFGHETLEEFYAERILVGYRKWDKNQDGAICLKPFPEQSNVPPYVANSIDNTARPR